MQDSSAVEVCGLNHWFGTGDARKQAMFDINLNRLCCTNQLMVEFPLVLDRVIPQLP